MERYDNVAMEIPISKIQIPVKIDKQELQNSLNQQLGDVLYEDTDMSDDDMMIRARKKEDIQLEVSADSLHYKVPLDLWIKKDVFLGSVEAEGQLELTFSTKFNIAPDWHFDTQTSIVDYQWLERPRLKLGLVDLPIQFIANKVLDRMQGLISTAIDQQVKNNLDLKTSIHKIWKEMHEPILLSEAYRTWLLFQPQHLSMSPLTANEDTIQSTIILAAQPMVILGQKPVLPIIQHLPDFGYQSTISDEFALYIGSDIPFAEIEEISKEVMIGETYSYGQKTVKIEDIELYGQGEKLVINTLLSGWYNGNIYLLGTPHYDEKTKQLALKNLKFEGSSKRFLLKSLSWLFRSQFKKEMEESVNVYLKKNIAELKTMIQKELQNYKVAEGIYLNGQLDDFLVTQVKIGQEVFKIELTLNGTLNMEVGKYTLAGGE